MNRYSSLLLEKRKKLDITQAELAKALRFSVQTIAKYEAGTNEMDVSTLAPVARLLQVDCDSFIIGVDAKDNDYADIYTFDRFRFAKNLALVRIARKLSQCQLASKCGCSSRSIKNYEAGKSLPSLTVFFYMCRALSVRACDLMFIDLSTREEFKNASKARRVVIAAGTTIGSLALITGMFFGTRAIILNNHKEQIEPPSTSENSNPEQESSISEENQLRKTPYLPHIDL